MPRNVRPTLLFALLMGFLPQPAVPQTARGTAGIPAVAGGCDQPGTDAVVVESVSGEGDIVLRDGRRMRVPGLDWRIDRLPAETWRQHREAVERTLAGRSFRFKLLVNGVDRWGRVRANLTDGPDGTALGGRALALYLAGAGMAVVVPADGLSTCLPPWLAAEDGARRAGLGLWGAGGLKVFAASDHAALQSEAGRFAVVSGRVISVGERPARTYMNFGRSYRRDFAAFIPKRFAARFRAAGIVPSSFAKKQVRVRGIVRVGRAPRIEVSEPHQIETLE